MTTSDEPPPSEDQPTRSTADRSIWMLIAAGVLLAAVVGATVVFGVARPPALASVGDAGTFEPSAGVAWLGWDRDRQCLHIALRDGTTSQPYCDRDGGEVIAWTSEGIVVASWTQSGAVHITVDPDTGAVIDRRTVSDDEQPFFDYPEGVRSYSDNGRTTVELDMSGTVVWEVDAVETYMVYGGWVSPDGEWVTMHDSADRLLVVPTDGHADPLVWVDPFDGWQVVWEGTGEPVG